MALHEGKYHPHPSGSLGVPLRLSGSPSVPGAGGPGGLGWAANSGSLGFWLDLGLRWPWMGREGELGQRPIQATPSPQPENILCVNTTGHLVKIIDFGLARRYHLRGWGGQGEPLRRAEGKGGVEGAWEQAGSCALSVWSHPQV